MKFQKNIKKTLEKILKKFRKTEGLRDNFYTILVNFENNLGKFLDKFL